MRIIKDKENENVQFVGDSEEKLLELGFFVNEFVFSFYTDRPIEITESDDENFYNALNYILNSKYIFDNKYSLQTEDSIVWFSDQYCDLDNEMATMKVNRLVIKRVNDKIYLSVFNPFFEKMGVKRSFYAVSLTPSGNGIYSENLNSGESFQNEIVCAYQKTLYSNNLNYRIK